MLQTIQKIGPLLDLFTIERAEWGAAEAAEALGLPRSSVYALLSSLAHTGLLQATSRGRYRIGWRVVELNEALRSAFNVRSVSHAVLERLVENYGETAHLAVMERSRVLYVDKTVGTHVVNVVGARVGAQLEPHCSAVGKVLLAHCGTDEEVLRILGDRPLRRLTSTTITDRRVLLDELAAVRRDGVAYDRGEAVADVHCVAAPVRDDMGVVIAAVSVTVPVNRFLKASNEFRGAVKAAADEITAKLSSGADMKVPPLLDDPTASLRRSPAPPRPGTTGSAVVST